MVRIVEAYDVTSLMTTDGNEHYRRRPPPLQRRLMYERLGRGECSHSGSSRSRSRSRSRSPSSTHTLNSEELDRSFHFAITNWRLGWARAAAFIVLYAGARDFSRLVATCPHWDRATQLSIRILQNPALLAAVTSWAQVTSRFEGFEHRNDDGHTSDDSGEWFFL